MFTEKICKNREENDMHNSSYEEGIKLFISIIKLYDMTERKEE